MWKSKKLSVVALVIICILIFVSCNTKREAINNYSKKVNCAVSIVPEATFVKEITGNLVNVATMIPPGSSPANYLPKPKELKQFSNSKIYFTIGVPAEKGIISKVHKINNNIKIVDLSRKVSQIYPDREFSPGNRDPHIWLSPKRVKIMIEEIAKQLSNIDEKNKETYKKNAQTYIKKLDRLDKEISRTLADANNKSFIVYHPAFGYFAEDYGLEMICLEENGKDIKIGNLTRVIDKAKQDKTKVIFYQKEIDSKKVEIFADEINGEAILLEPLAENYIENLYKTAKIFKKVMEYEE